MSAIQVFTERNSIFVIQGIERLLQPEDGIQDNRKWLNDPIGSLETLAGKADIESKPLLYAFLKQVKSHHGKLTLDGLLDMADGDIISLIAIDAMPRFSRGMKWILEPLGVAINPTGQAVKILSEHIGIQKAAIAKLSDPIISGIEGLLAQTREQRIPLELLTPKSIAIEVGEYLPKDELKVIYDPWFGCQFHTPNSLSIGWPFEILCVSAPEIHGLMFLKHIKGPRIFIVRGRFPGATDEELVKRIVAASTRIMNDCEVIIPSVNECLLAKIPGFLESHMVLGAWRPPFEHKGFYCLDDGQISLPNPK